MTEKEELIEWLGNHHISYNIRKDVLFIKGWGKALFQDMTDIEHIFKKGNGGSTVFNCIENYEYLIADEIYYVVFKFGNRFYYYDIRKGGFDFKVLRSVGNAVLTEVRCDYYPLGIHTGFELLNGSGSIEDWILKAKFLGYKGVGIADYSTMAGTLNLQKVATAEGMRYVFGYSLTIEIGDEKVGAKIYANTQKGFRNMLRIQKAVNVDREDRLIDYIELLNYSDGNCLVFDKWSGIWCVENESRVLECMKAFDGYVYFQVDTTEYKANRIDERILFSLKAFFDNYYIDNGKYKHNLRPVLIQDVYYIDKDDYKNKILLNKVDAGAAHEQSHEQYMKTLDELYDEFASLFSDKYGDDVFYDMCDATCEIAENSECAYDLSENYAPVYDMTEDEQLRYGNTHTMFNELLEDGFKRLVPVGMEEEYRKRLEYEKYVIESTDNINYFLITFDEVNWARRNGILIGIGRGSAGGCLVSYLLGITDIDPIKWGLIFERFLLPERGGLSPCEVTKFEEDVSSNNYVELELDNGHRYLFDVDAEFKVIRNGVECVVFADEIEEGDDIVWDRKDELLTLNEKFKK